MRSTSVARRGLTLGALASVVVSGGLSAMQRSAPFAPELIETGSTVASSQSNVSVRISGVIRQAKDKKPLQGANVTAMVDGVKRKESAVSDIDGRYTLELPTLARGGVVEVTVRRIGFSPQQSRFTVTGRAQQIDVALTPSSNLLESVVVSQASPNMEQKSVANATSTRVVAEYPSPSGSKATAKGVAGGTVHAPPMRAGATVAPATPATEMRREDRLERVRDMTNERLSDKQRDAARMADDREQYDRIRDNPFLAVSGNPRSTFSVDVDRASYGNIRRFLTQGQLPPADAVRIEEMVNYFPYRLAEPRGDAPVAITTEAMPAPWEPRHQLVRVALQARRIATDRLPASNLVFLIDVSGSMSSPDKLPLVKQSLRLLVEQLREQDRVAMVVYAGAAGLVLPSTSGDEKATIMAAIDRLESGGSTAGGAGLALAYRTAREHYSRGGNNRVILATDGDFNVGPSSDGEMERLIESKRAEGTYLTILGFGTGNYQDAKMQKLARVGNGNAAYVDDVAEARKVLVTEMGGTLVTVANDVKLQVEFNPAQVASYRLIGYEDRILRDEDFRDDKKDAGDMGAGHSVTALYEVVPVGVRGTVRARTSDPLRYQSGDELPRVRETNRVSANDELLHVSLRYKTPGESASKLLSKALTIRSARDDPSDDLRFAAAVASFGMLLRDSEHKGSATASSVLALARGTEDDEEGYRAEFVGLVERWRVLSRAVANRPGARER